MKLLIFDIDGTIIDSVKTDDKCFIDTFKQLYNIDLLNVKWSNFKNVTDTGLTIEIFEKYFNKTPSQAEINDIKNHFLSLLKKHVNNFKEINGAINFINSLHKNDYTIAFATGGWKETALLKCKSINFNIEKYIFKSSSDNYKRKEIIQLAIREATKYNNHFEKIFYFGDGIWDYKAAKSLNIEFIGVDFKRNNKLSNLEVKNIINDYSKTEILNSIIAK